MRLARVRTAGQVFLVRMEGDVAIPLVLETGEPGFDPLRRWLFDGHPDPIGEAFQVDVADIVAPVTAPQKIVAVGLNYSDHAAEQNKSLPATPMLFAKSPGAIIGPHEPIQFSTDDSDSVDYEAELAVIIGKRARNVTAAEALDYVLGYTAANDVSARDAQRNDVQYLRAKSFDSFCPIGPWIVTADEIPDPQALRIGAKVNGEVRQNGTTGDMIFGVAETISYASRFFSLEAGDVILTGTPAGVGAGRTPPLFLNDGDIVEVEIEAIGTLTNTVVTTNP